MRQLTLEGAERRAEVVRMRTGHMSWQQIGDHFGVSLQRAHQIFREAIDAAPAQAVAEHRAELSLLSDTAISELLALARDEDVSPRTRIEAWSAARGWAERKATLMGANAPSKIEQTVTDTTRQSLELAGLLAEASARAEAEDAPAAG